jgi:hypothetical protein
MGRSAYLVVLRTQGPVKRRELRASSVCLAACVLAVTVTCAPSQEPSPTPRPALSAPSEQPLSSPVVLASPLGAERVSLVAIIGDPKAWHRKAITTAGYMHLAFEGNRLCLHRDDFEYMIITNCVWLDAPYKGPLATLNDRYVGLEGVVNAENHGHRGMFQASIEGVTTVGALPRVAGNEK